jgi:lysylphosphatidylglycerol synthetase-like protein (DUF2156 family)
MPDTLISRDFVLRSIQEYTTAENPSAFLTVNDGNKYFTQPDLPGIIAYRTTSRHLVQLGGPFAPAESYRELLNRFREHADERGLPIVAVQLQERDAPVYADSGFTVNQIGASYAVELDGFTLGGTKFMQLRNKISRAHRNGLTVVEADYHDYAAAMQRVDQVWLPSKGEHVKQLEFLVGQYGGEMQSHRRLFVGLIEGELVGYISYSPVYGSRPGWMHDLSRRRPDNTPGIMEAINKAAIDTFSAEQVPWLHFGFTPFTTLRDDWELPGHSRAFNWFMHLLWEHGEAVYPARTQLAYKGKWAPSLVIPEYVAFQGPVSLTGFAHIFRACGAI